MATKIYTANVFVGELDNPFTLTNMILKKIPPHLLLSDSDFTYKIRKIMGDALWRELKKDKVTKLPVIKIHFVKQIGTVNQEPIIEAYQSNY